MTRSHGRQKTLTKSKPESDPMSFWQSLEFSYALTARHILAASVIWALVAFLVSFFVFGVLWGMVWNRSWGLFNHLPSAAVNLMFALAIAAAVIGWRGAYRAAALMDSERNTTAVEIAGSGTRNRAVLRDTWDKLYPLGGNMISRLQETVAMSSG
jgi:hypothetical protein